MKKGTKKKNIKFEEVKKQPYDISVTNKPIAGMQQTKTQVADFYQEERMPDCVC